MVIVPPALFSVKKYTKGPQEVSSLCQLASCLSVSISIYTLKQTIIARTVAGGGGAHEVPLLVENSVKENIDLEESHLTYT